MPKSKKEAPAKAPAKKKTRLEYTSTVTRGDKVTKTKVTVEPSLDETPAR
jgi:hypothetical protein